MKINYKVDIKAIPEWELNIGPLALEHANPYTTL